MTPANRSVNACVRAALAALLLAAFQASAAAQERAVDLELVLAADISGSMDLEEANLQRQGFVEALRHPEVIEAILSGPLKRIAITYVEWAGDQHQHTLVDWTEIADAASAFAFAKAVEAPRVRTALWTSISTVIAYAAQRFEDNGFKGERQVIDISGDGPNNKGEYVVAARDRAVAQGIIINGLPIVNDRPGPFGLPPMPNLDLYYEDCVIGGFGSFVVVANGFADFARAIRRKMLLEIAGRAPPAGAVRLYRVQNRMRPSCTTGEEQLRRYRDNDF